MQLQVIEGTDRAYRLAKKHGAKVAFGTDTLFDARLLARQGAQLAKLGHWYSPAEVLRMAIGENGRLLAMSGPRSPYPGKVGVLEAGAMADLLLVDGEPLVDLSFLNDPNRNLRIIMKDGALQKRTI